MAHDLTRKVNRLKPTIIYSMLFIALFFALIVL